MDLRDDRGSLPMAILVILLGTLLGALMLPMVLTQADATRLDTTRVHSLDAAQAGVDVMLGRIRASTTTDTNNATFGSVTSLPCYGQATPLVGQINAASTSRYSVWLTYYASNPATNPSSQMTCISGYGTYYTNGTTTTAVPRYAVITSTGTDGAAVNGASRGRTIVTTYVVQTDDTNIPGGPIELYPSSTTPYCMDAGSATPTAGTAVVLQTCSTSIPPAAQQVFAYRSDLSIQLVSSVTAANPNGMCIDTASATHTTGTAVVLQVCAIANPAKCASVTACSPWNQQWSINDYAHLEGALTTQSSTDGMCIDAVLQSAGTALILAPCVTNTTDPTGTWVPSATTGAGMAGAANSQLVNYKQFATCVDVTGQDPNAAYLILYTCKQNPNPANVAWNQKFTPYPALATGPTTVLLKTTANGTTYCLTSPQSAGGYVRVTTPCPATPNGIYAWTVSQAQDGNGNDLPYAQKYTIVDSQGRCLAPGPSTDELNGQYLKVVTAACDGSTGQKWNASASLDAARLTNTSERPGS